MRERKVYHPEWQAILEKLRNNDASFTRLDLENSYINSQQAEELAIALHNNHTLIELNLEENDLGNAGAIALANAMINNRTLVHVNLCNNKIGNESAIKWAAVLKDNSTLKTLSLANVGRTLRTGPGANKISNIGAKALAAALQSNATLEEFYLEGNNIGEEGLTELARMLEINKALRKLNLATNCINGVIGMTALAEALQENQTLRVLSLEGNQIDDKGAEVLADALLYNHALTNLYLYLNNIGYVGARALAAALKENRTLLVLGMENNPIGNIGIKALQMAKDNRPFPELSLGLSGNHFGDVVAIEAAEDLRNDPMRTELELRDKKIGCAGIIEFANTLKGNSTLKSLRLIYNKIGDAGAEALALALKDNSVLTELILAHNQIGDAGAIAMVRALKENYVLTELDMGHNQLSNKGAIALISGLNRTLTKINLEYNYQIDDAGVEALAPVLKDRSTIEELNLTRAAYTLGDIGAKALAVALTTNRSLMVLTLSLGNITNVGAQALAMALKVNRTLTALNLSLNPIYDAGAEELLSALKDNFTLIELEVTEYTQTHLGDVEGISEAKANEINALLERNRALRDKMHEAVKSGDISLVDQFLEQGVSLRVGSGNQNNTALHWAVITKQYPMAVHLIQRMKQQELRLNRKNNLGHTAMDLAKGTELESLFTANDSVANASHNDSNSIKKTVSQSFMPPPKNKKSVTDASDVIAYLIKNKL